MAAANRTSSFFAVVTARPRLTLVCSLLLLAACATGLGRLVKDTSVKAFIPDGHESLLADNKAAEVFGLSDTLAVAVVTQDGGSVFTPATLGLIADLTEQIALLDNVRADRVSSLATESSIAGEAGAILVDPYIDRFALDAAFAADSQRRWESMPPHRGTLVSDDGSGAVILAELVDARAADSTYEAVRELVAGMARPGVEIHVAGPGAVSGYLSRYIDNDARKLQPLVFLLVLGFIYFAFRRFAALPGPLLVVAGSAAGSIGLMAWAGVPYYAITNALPVIVVAISVADAIHILSAFYQMREENPQASNRELVIRSMCAMARPITLTTITTIAGFAGIAATSIMPPITWFAVFASVGVALAWLFSIVVLPNVLLLVDPGHSPAFLSWREHRPSESGRLLARIGAYSPLRYSGVLAVFLLLAGIAVHGASQLRVDRSQVENFAKDEPIRVADELINDRFAGTAFLDIIVEADEPEGLLRVERMQKIAALQAFFETLPNVQKTVSIVDYVGELHHAIEELPDSVRGERRLPGTDAALAETLFVYEVSGNPTDFEEEIDGDYRTALLRGVLNEHYYSRNRSVVEALQAYIDETFNEPGLRATLTGDVNVSYHWMQGLQSSHFEGIACSLLLVLAASVFAFRSIAAGLIAVVPVLFTILVLYACMGYLGIYLEPATSMFAAIALGVGVDFAIHLVDRLRCAADEYGGDVARAIDLALPPVARACFFNSAALGIGFSVLLVSDLPTLMRFGGLVALAAFSSYVVALVIVPALFAAERQWFGTGRRALRKQRAPVSLLLLVSMLLALASGDARAETDEALRIAQKVAAREEGTAARRVIDMTLTNRRGRSETRVAIVHKLSTAQRRQTRITFVEPKKSRGVTFLSFDYRQVGASDERWMYIPVSRKVRRIPASQRGKSFLGTDFSYEDVQSELKLNLDDWDFEYLGHGDVAGRPAQRIAGSPKTAAVARELGYGAFEAAIDERSWMPVRIEFFDLRGRPLKTIDVASVEQIDGIWTARDILASNHQTGHSTRFLIEDISYPDSLPETLFDPRGLARELPAVAGD